MAGIFDPVIFDPDIFDTGEEAAEGIGLAPQPVARPVDFVMQAGWRAAPTAEYAAAVRRRLFQAPAFVVQKRERSELREMMDLYSMYRMVA